MLTEQLYYAQDALDVFVQERRSDLPFGLSPTSSVADALQALFQVILYKEKIKIEKRNTKCIYIRQLELTFDCL